MIIKPLINLILLIVPVLSFALTSYNQSGQVGNSSASDPLESLSGSDRLKVLSVKITPQETILTLSDHNMRTDGMAYAWIQIDANSYIVANGKEYRLNKAEGIEISPNKTYFSYVGETKTFKLYFPPIPTYTKSIDFIESESSGWKIYGIQLY